MFKKILLVLLGIVIVVPIIGSIVGVKLGQFEAMGEAGANMKMPPTPVNSVVVSNIDWVPRIAAIGSVVAIKGTTISAEVEGSVREIFYTPGANVAAGAPLARLDVAIEKAQLHEAEVSAKWARIAFDRAKELSKTKNISIADMDTAETNISQADAKVEYFQALIAKKTFHAPFAGKLGISHITLGQFLSKGAPIISLQSLDPVYVHFSLPQNQFGQVKEGLKVRIGIDAYPGKFFTGQISAIDPGIDPSTRSFRIQATLDNPDHLLRPGMFVSVEVITDVLDRKLFIPATAVLYGPYGDSVFVIEKQPGEGADSSETLVIRQQLVRLGAKQGDFVAVSEGLAEGVQIVATGAFKLMPQMPVVIDNALLPEFKLTPTPENN
ncbi:MAG: efflux RND transporter periplasmic adaptor subunit [Hahellaceae bacterium]|nr:efflux RND transporter periplasmic adaptor subunit [Hahellaceae bacterium]